MRTVWITLPKTENRKFRKQEKAGEDRLCARHPADLREAEMLDPSREGSRCLQSLSITSSAGKPFRTTKRAFYGSGLAKDQTNSSHAICGATRRSSKEGKIGVKMAKPPLGDIIADTRSLLGKDSREELTHVPGLLQLLDKNYICVPFINLF